MALQLTISINIVGQTLSFPNAYLKVSKINGDKNNITASLDYLTDKDGQLIQRKDYTFTQNLTGENVIKQSYLYLKTLPEFFSAIDC